MRKIAQTLLACCGIACCLPAFSASGAGSAPVATVAQAGTTDPIIENRRDRAQARKEYRKDKSITKQEYRKERRTANKKLENNLRASGNEQEDKTTIKGGQ